MKKLALASFILLTGCSVSNNDPIIGHWSEENKICGQKPFCSFTVKKGGSALSSAYSIKFDVVTPDFPNTGTLTPNYKGTEGVYWYTDIGTKKGIMMYIDRDVLIETYDGTRFRKDL